MNYTLAITQGVTFTETVEVKTAVGVAEDLTGSTFLLQIRDYSFSTDYKINATDANGLLNISAVTGIVTIKLPPSETIKLTSSRAVYDLIQTKANGEKYRLVGGDVEVTYGVSR